MQSHGVLIWHLPFRERDPIHGACAVADSIGVCLAERETDELQFVREICYFWRIILHNLPDHVLNICIWEQD